MEDKSVSRSFYFFVLLKRAIKNLLIAYLVFIIAMFSIQRMILFPATRELARDPSFFNWDYDDVVLEVGKEKTHGWYIPLENARGVALFSHGNAGNIGDRLESIGLLRSFGFSVLAYDYGGYGKSSGSPSETRCYADVRAMWEFLLQDKGYTQEQILLFGRSLGGAVTCDIAAGVVPGAVVIESTFTSIPDMAQHAMPLLPARWLVRDKFANDEKIDKIKSPLLIVHSQDDSLIPFAHGQKLFALAKEPKAFIQINGDHNTGFVESEKVYRKGWEEFLEKYFPKE